MQTHHTQQNITTGGLAMPSDLSSTCRFLGGMRARLEDSAQQAGLVTPAEFAGLMKVSLLPGSSDIRQEAAVLLSRADPLRGGIGALLMSYDCDETIRTGAMQQLGQVYRDIATTRLENIGASDPSPYHRVRALQILQALGAPEAAALYRQLKADTGLPETERQWCEAIMSRPAQEQMHAPAQVRFNGREVALIRKAEGAWLAAGSAQAETALLALWSNSPALGMELSVPMFAAGKIAQVPASIVQQMDQGFRAVAGLPQD